MHWYIRYTRHMTCIIFSEHQRLFVVMSSIRRSSNTTMYLTSTLLLLLLLLLSIGMATKALDVDEDSDPFSPSSYCHNVCSLGRGGNACKCTATKFAGKRSQMPPSLPAAFDSSFGGSLTRSDIGLATRRLVTSRLHANRQNTRHYATLRWIGNRLQQSGTTENNNNFLRAEFTVWSRYAAVAEHTEQILLLLVVLTNNCSQWNNTQFLYVYNAIILLWAAVTKAASLLHFIVRLRLPSLSFL